MSHEQAFAYPSFSRREVLTIMSGLMLAMFLASLDQTIVATALSSIGRDLNGWRSIAWVVSAYLVTSTTTTPIYGRLSDLYGRRPVLLVSIALFVVSSVLCALCTTMPQLIAARSLQGIGGGGLRSVSQAVIADIIPPRERGRYQGYLSSVFATSNVLGPVLGGFFSDYLSWHWIFWINIPLGLGAFALSSHFLAKLRVPSRRPKIDWLGAALILASATPILIGVANAERAGGWLSLDAAGPIAGGLLAILALILQERVAREPMLPLRLFQNSIFSVGSAISFLVFAVMIGLIVLVPMNYQLAAGLAANEAGLRMVPMTVGTVCGSFIAGHLVSRTGRYRIFPIIGTSIGTVACAVIAYAGLGHSLAFDIAVTLVLGMSFGGQLSPMIVTVQNSLHAQDTGVGLSCLMFFRLMGGAFGVAFLSTILIANLTASALAVPGHEVLGPNPGLALFHLDDPGNHLTPALLAALGDAIRQAFSHVFMIAAILLGCGVLGALTLKEVPLRGR